ncbi:DsrE family protein [Aestuariicoccus sp. MJ-SS9]|uniref:DsrE family protein n=1 Tax=Aestuariicoccus sp. MJ-SS9 TaxID=3079855 RepID=UPI00290B5D5F|nr:DsrE family protein [Aestuariicoccus sp. MJ-SS9]MDU8912778.1 DsrE family protein [Aestuariicoccus sp. MJ-SS9]
MKHLLSAAVLALATQASAEGLTHRVAIHVNQADPAVMNTALNNAQNVYSHYAEQGDAVIIEMVAYGPGLQMFVPGKSPVEQRISTMSLEMDNLKFSACGNTLKKMEKKVGHEVALMSEAEITPSGVVRLIELQQQGYAYVRP